MFEKADELTQFLNEDSIVWYNKIVMVGKAAN